MKKILLLILVLVAGWQLTEKKPEWFLKMLTKIPMINTDVVVDFEQIPEGISEQQLIKEYDHLLLYCAYEPSNLGDRVCSTHISEFNEIEAKVVAFFFDDDRFRYLRVSFPVEEHQKLISWLDSNYKQSARTPGSKEMFGQPLKAWRSSRGILAAFADTPTSRQETLLTWVSFDKARVAR